MGSQPNNQAIAGEVTSESQKDASLYDVSGYIKGLTEDTTATLEEAQVIAKDRSFKLLCLFWV